MIAHTRAFASRQRTLTAVAQEILSPSDRRYAVIIPPPVQGTAFIGADNTVSIGNGIPLWQDMQPLVFVRDQMGDLVRRGLWAVGLAAFGENKRYTTNYLRSGATGAGAQIASLVCPAGQYIEIDGWAYGINVAEIGNYVVADATPLNHVDNYAVGGLVVSLDKPLRAAVGRNVTITGSPGATSTRTAVAIWGRTLQGPVGLSFSLNLTVIEIFDCSCPDPTIEELVGKTMKGR